MNRVALLQLLLAGIGMAALPVGALVLQPTQLETVPLPRGGQSARGGGPKPGARPIDSLARAATARAPFRLSRRPAGIPYDPDRGALVTGPQPAASKPSLSVSGVAWGGGVQPTAVLEGIPGTAGPRAVRPGDRIGGLSVHHIQPDRVIVTGFDTTWTLRMKVPWP